MKEIHLGTILPRRAKVRGEEGLLVARYVERVSRYVACASVSFESEEAFFQAAERGPGRAAAVTVLFDGRGQMLSSEEFARMVGRLRDEGAQRLLLGIGPADGWSEGARRKAGASVSFGRITLPHELAQVVAAEQIYRAMTILAGHPYHCGHSG